MSIEAVVCRCGAHPSISPRLILTSDRLGVEDERRLGTFMPTAADPIEVLAHAGLRGRGGAGFSTARKLATVRAAAGAKVIVANGGEGEPSSLKDRWLLAHRPHLVLDGLLRAADAIGAGRTIIFVTDPDLAVQVQAAVGDHPDRPGRSPVEVRVGPDRYVAGEETAVCRLINGGPALPTDKPPRPYERGVDGASTAVLNVETLAHLSFIVRHGAAAYRAYGTDESPGTTLVTLAGSCHHPGVYEVPFGLSLEEMFCSIGGGWTSTPSAFLIGGWFGGVLGPAGAALCCTHEHAAAAGTGIGCAAFTAVGIDDDVLGMTAAIGRWYAAESAQQCGVCIKGTAAIAAALGAVARGDRDALTLGKLIRWRRTLRGRGACALLDGAAVLAGSVAEEILS